MLKNIVRASSIALCLIALGYATTIGVKAQNAELDFKLVNQTGSTIVSIYIAPHDSDAWGDDVMDEDVLANNASVDITFHPKAKAALWDLRIEDKAGTPVEWESLDLTKIEELTIKIVKGKPVATWK